MSGDRRGGAINTGIFNPTWKAKVKDGDYLGIKFSFKVS